jgi:hypothetical protein
LNAWIRSGVFDGFIEWADACEPSRDSGRWAISGEKSELFTFANGTVGSLISATRFFGSGTGLVGNEGAQGVIIWTSGPNTGSGGAINGTNGGDITLSATPTNAIAVGHTFRIGTRTAFASDDGQHPRQAVDGKGGQMLIRNPTAAYLTALNA